MKIISLIIIITFLNFTVGGNAESIKTKQYTSGDNWRKVLPGRHSYHVSIRSNKKPDENICSGVILSTRFILTSATCIYSTGVVVKKDASELFLVVGELQLRHPIKSNTYYVKLIIVHKLFKEGSSDHNLAVLMPAPIMLNEYIRPVNLPSDDIPLYPPTKVMLTAWNKQANVSAFITCLNKLKI